MHHFLQYTRVQLEGCSRDKLRSRALDLRDALGWTQHEAPLPSTQAQLVDWILKNQAVAPLVDHSHEDPVAAPNGVSGYHNLKLGADPTKWQKLKADWTPIGERSASDGQSLKIDGHPVMESWEKPYMEALADVATMNGGRVFEVGFGLHLSADGIQRHNIDEHIILEANEDVFASCMEWAKQQPNRVTPMLGLWQDSISKIPDNSVDGILYDTYPLNKEEQHTHQFDFIREAYRVLKPGGILTYCNLTSLGVLKSMYESWEQLFEETQRPYLEQCGFKDVDFSAFRFCPVTPPGNCEYYSHPYAMCPVIYKK